MAESAARGNEKHGGKKINRHRHATLDWYCPERGVRWRKQGGGYCARVESPSKDRKHGGEKRVGNEKKMIPLI